MAWFIIQCERKTWTKYLVQADNVDTALQACDDWEYLGYIDGDDTDFVVIGDPFETRTKLLSDSVSYVEH
jgi:hypothetical protein